MATAKQETTKATPKARAPKATPVLAGKAQASRHAASLLRSEATKRDAAHGILVDTGMVVDGKWVGFPEGFGSFLAIAKAITPQPVGKDGKRLSTATVGYVDVARKPATDVEKIYNRNVHTVSDALTKVSVEYGRVEGTSKGTRSAQPEGKANGAKGKGASVVKMTAATARSVAKALTDKGTPAATVKAFRASIAEQITILAARGVKDDAMYAACQTYVQAFGGLQSKAPTPATVKASRPNMPGSQVT